MSKSTDRIQRPTILDDAVAMPAKVSSHSFRMRHLWNDVSNRRYAVSSGCTARDLNGRGCFWSLEILNYILTINIDTKVIRGGLFEVSSSDAMLFEVTRAAETLRHPLNQR